MILAVLHEANGFILRGGPRSGLKPLVGSRNTAVMSACVTSGARSPTKMLYSPVPRWGGGGLVNWDDMPLSLELAGVVDNFDPGAADALAGRGLTDGVEARFGVWLDSGVLSSSIGFVSMRPGVFDGAA